jgi:hypothetical protein
MIARVSRFDRAAPSSRSGKYVSQTFEHHIDFVARCPLPDASKSAELEPLSGTRRRLVVMPSALNQVKRMA